MLSTCWQWQRLHRNELKSSCSSEIQGIPKSASSGSRSGLHILNGNFEHDLSISRSRRKRRGRRIKSQKDQAFEVKIRRVESKLQSPILSLNINVRIEKGSLTAIIGAVGAGKTALIHGFLGELKLRPIQSLKSAYRKQLGMQLRVPGYKTEL